MQKKMADVISTLPTDKIPPTPEEDQILNWLFPPSLLEKETKNENIKEPASPEEEEVILTQTNSKERNKKMYSLSLVLVVLVSFFLLNLNIIPLPFQNILNSNPIINSLTKTLLFLFIFVIAIVILKRI